MRNGILNFITSWCKKHDRYRIIYDRDGTTPYMERYYLLFKNRPSWFPFNITLHKICLSDLPVLHDHPWPYAALILKGGYIEHTKYRLDARNPGSFRIRGAEQYHWLELPEGQVCWSLFFMGKRRREWGFLKNDEWMQHQEYLDWRENATPEELQKHEEEEALLNLIRPIARLSVKNTTPEQRKNW